MNMDIPRADYKEHQFVKAYDEIKLLLATLLFEEKISNNTFDLLKDRLNGISDSRFNWEDFYNHAFSVISLNKPVEAYYNDKHYRITIEEVAE